MSRRDVPCLIEGHRAVVGWDPPLRTFFGQVVRIDDDIADPDVLPDPVIHWVGARHVVHSLPALVEAMAGYAQLEPDVLRQLFQDCELNR